MQDRDQRLDAVRQHLVKHLVVECKPCLIRLCIIPVWKNACPGNGKTQNFESHFCKQCNVFLVVMIKISRHMARIVIALLQDALRARRDALPLSNRSFSPIREAIKDLARLALVSIRDQICNSKPFSIFCIAALILVGCGGAAPKKVLWKCHFLLLYSAFCASFSAIRFDISTKGM